MKNSISILRDQQGNYLQPNLTTALRGQPPRRQWQGSLIRALQEHNLLPDIDVSPTVGSSPFPWLDLQPEVIALSRLFPKSHLNPVVLHAYNTLLRKQPSSWTPCPLGTIPSINSLTSQYVYGKRSRKRDVTAARTITVRFYLGDWHPHLPQATHLCIMQNTQQPCLCPLPSKMSPHTMLL